MKKKKKVIIEENKFESAVRYFPDSKNGLTSSQVQERIDNKLTNEKKKKYSKTLLSIIFNNVFTFFNMLLLGIAIALIAVKSFSNLFFLVIVSLNTLIGIYQENKAKKMVDSLKLLTEPMASVIRDGREIIIPTDQICLDDIVVLSAGKEIPVDAQVVDGFAEVNESLLTGESVPLKKNPGDKIFAGSFVVSGTIYVQAEQLGDFTYVSKLQEQAKKQKKVKSILLQTLNNIIRVISIIIVPLGIANFIVNLLQTNVIEEVIAGTAGSLVAMIPSGLFLLVSTTLYVSVTRLGKKHALVQELYSIESLARSNVLCLDKTGTITDGTMHLTKTDSINDEEDFDNIVSSLLASFKESNLTSDALKRKYNLPLKYEAIVTVPFSSDRKYSAVTFKDKGTYFLGAPEYLCEDNDVLKECDEHLNKGHRVLLLTKIDKEYDPKLSKQGKPVSMFILEDHIREDAFDTVRWFQDNDVELKVISGDNPFTVRKIAEKVGIKNADKCISLEGMPLEKIKERALQYTIFGRVSPEQKATIIKTLKANEKTVAMTGDGVNDILALKQANCAIAMAAGSEAARNCSHIVLMDSSFSSMPKIVEEGRRVINNIQNAASLFIMKTVYAILLSFITITCSIIGFGFAYPFAPKHLYVLEFAVIGIPSFFLALQQNKKLVEGNFLKHVLSKSFPAGLSILLSVLLVVFVYPHIAICDLVYSPAQLNDVSTTIACASLSFLGLLILYTKCFPLNKYRTCLAIGMTLLSLGIAFVLPSSLSGMIWDGVTINNVLTLIFNVVVCFLIYLLLQYLMSRSTNLVNKMVQEMEKHHNKDDEED